jgi:hypothetical protein
MCLEGIKNTEQNQNSIHEMEGKAEENLFILNEKKTQREVQNTMQPQKHPPTSATVTFRNIWPKSNFAQVEFADCVHFKSKLRLTGT